MTSLRQLVDDVFAQYDARADPVRDAPPTERAVPPTQSAEVEARAQKMLDGIVEKRDLTPKARVLMMCVLETLVETADRVAALERRGSSS